MPRGVIATIYLVNKDVYNDCHCTVAMNEVSQIEIQFSDCDAHMLRVDAETRVSAVRRLLQPLSIRTLQRDSTEQYHHHQVEPPHLVRLAQTVDPPHLALLVRVAEDADRRPLASDAHNEIFATFLYDVLP